MVHPFLRLIYSCVHDFNFSSCQSFLFFCIPLFSSFYFLHCILYYSILFYIYFIFLLKVDGRSRTAVRTLACSPDVLPSVHGSSFFQRGDTHVLCTTTLGTRMDAKTYFPINGAKEEKSEMFYLHYDFPPYCTGETGTFCC